MCGKTVNSIRHRRRLNVDATEIRNRFNRVLTDIWYFYCVLRLIEGQMLVSRFELFIAILIRPHGKTGENINRKLICGIDERCVWRVSSCVTIEILFVESFSFRTSHLKVSHAEGTIMGPIGCIASIICLAACFGLLHCRIVILKCGIVELWTEAMIAIREWSVPWNRERFRCACQKCKNKNPSNQWYTIED